MYITVTAIAHVHQRHSYRSCTSPSQLSSCVEFGECRIRQNLCRVQYGALWVFRTLGKEDESCSVWNTQKKMRCKFFLNKFVPTFVECNMGFVECIYLSTRQSDHSQVPGKELRRVPRQKALGKVMEFAMCQKAGTRQSAHLGRVPAGRHTAK